MRAYTVKEPAVVADHYGTAGEVLQAFLQCTQGVDVDIVRGLVEQQHVRLALEREREMQAVTLTAGQHAALLLLVGTGEVKPAQVRACVDLTTAYADELRAVGDGLIHCFVRVDVRVHLIDVAHLDCLAYGKRAFVGLLHAHDHAEQGCLACAVGSDNTYNAVRRQHEVQILHQQFVTKRLAYALCIDNLVAQTRTVGNEYLKFLLALFLLLVQHAVVGAQTSFGFCLSCFGCHTHPLQFALQGLAAFAGLLLLHRHARGLLLEP